jgi:heptosyltransferase II
VKNLPKEKIGRILIRAVNWLGDAVMTTPAIGALRESFPDAKLVLLATPLVAQLFAGHPWLDQVLVYDRKGRHAGVLGRLKLARELRRERFDLAVLLPNSFDSALIAFLAGVPRRLGFNTDGRGMLLSHPVRRSEAVLAGHQTGYYLGLLAPFAIGMERPRQLLYTSAQEDAECAGLLSAAGVLAADDLIGINPGATYGSAKRWRPERFAQVADQLAARRGGKVVLFGGPDEVGIATEIEAAMQVPCLNLAGKTTVRSMMALIKRCNLFITNDSGPMHIAAAFGVPLVAVFGSTDHTTTFPLGDRAQVVRKDVDCAPCMKRECPTDHRCMTAVTAQDVLDAVERL